MQPDVKALPPWTLTGDGIVLIYRFTKQFNKEYAFLSDYQHQGYKGWMGAVILADYKTSDAGPYQELLFIPGLFNLDGKTAFSISKIYVSTYDSQWNGIENWGIPKELADFNFVNQADGSQLCEIGRSGKTFFTAHIKRSGPRFPVSTKLLPRPQIMQQFHGQWLLTRPDLSGKMQLASLQRIFADPAYFPPIHQVKPLITLSIQDFLMTFPLPDPRT